MLAERGEARSILISKHKGGAGSPNDPDGLLSHPVLSWVKGGLKGPLHEPAVCDDFQIGSQGGEKVGDGGLQPSQITTNAHRKTH